jgi:quinol monooxygenase YgiN
MYKVGQTYTSSLWTAKKGKEATLIAAWENFAKWSSQQRLGLIEAALLQDSEQPQRFVSYGVWQNPQGIQAWRQRPEFREFVTKVQELCQDMQPPRMSKSVATVGGG